MITIDGNKNSRIWDKLYTNLALFGDSNLALFFSFTLLVLSFLISLCIDGNINIQNNPLSHWWKISPTETAYRKLGPTPNIVPPKIFHIDTNNQDDDDDNDNDDYNLVSQEMQESFDRDGVIAIRGLLDLDLLRQIDYTTADIISKEKEKMKAKEKKKPKLLTGRKKTPKQFFTVNQGAIFSSFSSPIDDENNSTSTTSTSSHTVSPFCLLYTSPSPRDSR